MSLSQYSLFSRYSDLKTYTGTVLIVPGSIIVTPLLPMIVLSAVFCVPCLLWNALGVCTGREKCQYDSDNYSCSHYFFVKVAFYHQIIGAQVQKNCVYRHSMALLGMIGFYGEDYSRLTRSTADLPGFRPFSRKVGSFVLGPSRILAFFKEGPRS